MLRKYKVKVRAYKKNRRKAITTKTIYYRTPKAAKVASTTTQVPEVKELGISGNTRPELDRFKRAKTETINKVDVLALALDQISLNTGKDLSVLKEEVKALETEEDVNAWALEYGLYDIVNAIIKEQGLTDVKIAIGKEAITPSVHIHSYVPITEVLLDQYVIDPVKPGETGIFAGQQFRYDGKTFWAKDYDSDEEYLNAIDSYGSYLMSNRLDTAYHSVYMFSDTETEAMHDITIVTGYKCDCE